MLPRQARTITRPPPGHPRALLLLALLAALVPCAAVPALASGGNGVEAARLGRSLTKATHLARHRLAPATSRLAHGLAGEAGRMPRLREAAGTTQAQIQTALAELRRFGPVAALDPHYLAALVAAGRAFMAVSGEDPLSGTVIDPEYAGLATELTAGEAALVRSAGEAEGASATVRRLERELGRARRQVRRLEHRLGAARPGPRRR